MMEESALSEVKKHERQNASRQFKLFGLMSIEQLAQVVIIIVTVSMFAQSIRTTQADNTRRIEALESLKQTESIQRDQMLADVAAIRESQARVETALSDMKEELHRRESK